MTETEKTKTKHSKKGKAKTIQPMNKVVQFEDRVSRSRSKHEGESSADICDRLSRTGVSSQRQLPTDHDYAVPTREYQLDQSSPLPASAAADPVLEIQKQKPPHRFEDVDKVTPYQCPIGPGWGGSFRTGQAISLSAVFVHMSGNCPRSLSVHAAACEFESLTHFRSSSPGNQDGGMADGVPRTQLQRPSLRSGMPSYLHQLSLRHIAMQQHPSGRRSHRRRPTP
jgi:hypothetical protein